MSIFFLVFRFMAVQNYIFRFTADIIKFRSKPAVSINF